MTYKKLLAEDFADLRRYLQTLRTILKYTNTAGLNRRTGDER